MKLIKPGKSIILTRRSALLGVSAVVASSLSVSPIGAARQLVRTPTQTEGPFYPESWKGDIDNDLVVVKGEAAKALGTVLHLSGTVTNIKGEPVASALVEIWQCDARGVYRHSEDESPTRKHDKGFQGYGRVMTNKNGQYKFRTIRPVSYPGRTPHIHFKVRTRTNELTTQMYVHGESQNRNDFLLNEIRNRKLRDRLIVKLSPADRVEPGSFRGVFDLMMS